MTKQSRSTRVWLLLSAALAAVIAYQWRSAFPLVPPVTAVEIATASIDDAEPPTFVPPPPDILSAIVKRPLFAASRRPAGPATETAAEAPAKEPGTLLELHLIGTMVTGRGRAALLRQGDAAIRRVRLGDELCGWRITRIDRTGMMLIREGEVFSLNLPAPGRKQAGTANKPIRCVLEPDAPATKA